MSMKILRTLFKLKRRKVPRPLPPEGGGKLTLAKARQAVQTVCDKTTFEQPPVEDANADLNKAKIC